MIIKNFKIKNFNKKSVHLTKNSIIIKKLVIV